MIRHLLVLVLGFLVIGAPAEEKPATALFMISEPEYQTATTLPEFANTELKPRGITPIFSIADAGTPAGFPGLDALPTADLLIVSVRRQAPRKEQLALVRAHLAAGKPLIGIRTASHAFGAKPQDDQHEGWMTFDQDVLGGSYKGHHGNVPAVMSLAPNAAGHAILAGVDPAQLTSERLYKNATLASPATALLMGRSQGEKSDEHVAWTNLAGRSRVFYTSLGAAPDFAKPAFRRLLTNAVFWALERTPPAE